ncbi:hypothetical protein [Paucibacter sp. KBW04]|uniref:hypothetical protein n=1 Tax=Paucibacter sp. KBW04 TaxID=2153361 RepID=UPI0018CC70A5|nr:hypothetical protein [Paucibacter sp. KBW04]
MKTIAIALSLLLSCSGPVLAGTDAAASKPPLIGVWAVDTARLPMPPAARPKSVTISFSEAEGGRLKALVEVIDPSGAPLRAEGVTPLDGSATAVSSNFEADMSATTMPRPEVLIMQLAKGGVPASTRIYTVLEDGNSMLETVAFFSADGKPVFRKNYFSRLR